MTRTAFIALSFAFTLSGCQSAPKGHTETPLHLRAENAGVTGSLEVHLTGITPATGQLFVELYDRSTYFDYQKVLNEQIVPVTGGEMTVVLEHVPAGRYMAVGSLDANANFELDTGAFGVPTEPYGFSRKARGVFGPPEFEVGAFDFDGTTMRVELELR